MKRSKEEKAADRERFRRLSFAQKAEHIWIYYKWPILLGLVFLIIVVPKQFADALLDFAPRLIVECVR